jgi:hypothetical protein
MIISASRRTDIPAFYSEWFVNRLRDGYALIQNPRNPHRLGRVELAPDKVDCIVFWTKNPLPMLGGPGAPDTLGTLDRMGYKYYFEFTLTPYGRSTERNLPPKERLVETFQRLSERIGPNRVDWRYDPVLITHDFPVAYHLEQFEKLCDVLYSKTKRCVLSFVDQYRHLKDVPGIQSDAILAVAEGFSRIAEKYSLPLLTCAEAVYLEQFSIAHAACIDKRKIESILGTAIEAKKDEGQRPACGCIASVDIGAYDTCPHGCAYCYATTSAGLVARRVRDHAPESPLLTGFPRGDELITDRTTGSQKLQQLTLIPIG